MSVPSNIAEGQGHKSRHEFAHFLSHARGSLMEVETQLLLAEALHYISHDETAKLLGSSAEIGRMLNGLMQSLSAAAAAKSKAD